MTARIANPKIKLTARTSDEACGGTPASGRQRCATAEIQSKAAGLKPGLYKSEGAAGSAEKFAYDVARAARIISTNFRAVSVMISGFLAFSAAP